VIGNGPSLRPEDLDRLGSEITFASNKIYLVFDQIAWRPSYYSVCDPLVAQNNRETINGLELFKVFGDPVKSEFADRTDIIWLRELTPPDPHFWTRQRSFSRPSRFVKRPTLSQYLHLSERGPQHIGNEGKLVGALLRVVPTAADCLPCASLL
jgi:hypothetical protein